MAVAFRLHFSGGGLAAEAGILRATAAFDKQHFHETVGKAQVRSIQERVRREGRDVDGASLAPLAETTVKSAFPRPAPGQRDLPSTVRGPGHVLEATGKMLRDVTFEADVRRARVYFADPASERVAGFHVGGTRPYRIVPKSARVLRIPLVLGALRSPAKSTPRLKPIRVDAAKGQRGVIALAVNHPGLKVRNFFGFARYPGRDDLQRAGDIALRMIRAAQRAQSQRSVV